MATENMAGKAFIEEIGPLASADMRESGVLASVTLAQAILESRWGLSGLAVIGNALFGIKAGASWKGKVYDADTNECYDGKTFEKVHAVFRAYDSWAESVKDHAALLTGNARYAAVVGEADYKAACLALQAAGYATDPQYAEKLIEVIESNGLTVYDGAAAERKGEEVTMTEQERKLREKVVKTAQSYLGAAEGSAKHKEIIDGYNADSPLPRNYRVTYTDAWCATFVSYVAVRCALKTIIPKECSCARMIALFQQMGRWQESDAHVPSAGDVIFYDWQDSGIGDNKGAPDHVGIVVSVSGSSMLVIEGNYKDAVTYRNMKVDGKYIRGYGLPDYASLCAEAAPNVTVESEAFVVGSRVNFTGNKHYVTADAQTGNACKPGTATITMMAPDKKHPFHLVAEIGGGSNVYGWVDSADVSLLGKPQPVMKAGATVAYTGPIYKTSDGTGRGKNVSGNFAVQYYSPDKKCGVHLEGIGWVSEYACTVIA